MDQAVREVDRTVRHRHTPRVPGRVLDARRKMALLTRLNLAVTREQVNTGRVLESYNPRVAYLNSVEAIPAGQQSPGEPLPSLVVELQPAPSAAVTPGDSPPAPPGDAPPAPPVNPSPPPDPDPTGVQTPQTNGLAGLGPLVGNTFSHLQARASSFFTRFAPSISPPSASTPESAGPGTDTTPGGAGATSGDRGPPSVGPVAFSPFKSQIPPMYPPFF